MLPRPPVGRRPLDFVVEFREVLVAFFRGEIEGEFVVEVEFEFARGALWGVLPEVGRYRCRRRR